MADAYYEIAQELRRRPALQLSSKGTQWDRVYVEQETRDVTKANPRYPQDASDTLAVKCIPGAKHPKCEYLMLVDAYVTGGDDHKQNWALTYQLDLRAFAAAFPNEIPDWQAELARDGVQTVFPAEDTSPDITWTFTIVNPDNYVKPSQGSPHPLVASALFINEEWQRNGPTLTVTRRYRKVAPVSAQQKVGYQVEYEYRLQDGAASIDYPVVTWTYDTPKADFTVPAVNATCGIAGFTTLKVIKPAQCVVLDGLNLRVTITYGKIPGPLIVKDGIGDGPAGQYSTYTWRRPYDAMPSRQPEELQDLYPGVPVLNWQIAEDNGYCLIWTYTQLRKNSPLASAEYRPETGETFPVSVRIVPADTAAQAIKSTGEYTTIEALNKDHAVETTRQDTGLATGRVFTTSRHDGQTGELYEETVQIIDGTHGSEFIGEKVESVGYLVQQLSLGKSRKIKVYDYGLANKKEQIGAKFDPNTGRTRKTWRKLVPNGTPGMDISPSGEVQEVTPIDSKWALLTSEFVHGYVDGQTRPGYYTYEVFPLPGVLRGYHLWNYGSGRSVQIGVNYYIEEKTGPLLCYNEETWYHQAPLSIQPTSINGTSLQFSFPGGGISIPECLHPGQVFTWADGEGYVLTHYWPATTHIDWPATIVLGETKPFMGGYLQTKKTLYVK